MNSQEIVELLNLKLDGQLRLFADYDLILRNTKFDVFDSLSDEQKKSIVVHWWMNVYVPDGYGDFRTEYEVYRTWSNSVSNNFKYIKTGGYYPETSQSAISIACYKKDELQPQIDELKLFLPFIKELPKKNCKKIGIFESTLSENGVYDLAIFSDKIELELTRYSHLSVLKTFSSIEEAVAYVHKNYWYDKGSYNE